MGCALAVRARTQTFAMLRNRIIGHTLARLVRRARQKALCCRAAGGSGCRVTESVPLWRTGKLARLDFIIGLLARARARNGIRLPVRARVFSVAAKRAPTTAEAARL